MYKFSRYVNFAVFAVDLAKREILILEFYSPVTCDKIHEDMEERGAISTFNLTSEIHEYHVYKEIWTAIVGKECNCECEFGNRHDPYAVIVMKDGRRSRSTHHFVCLLYVYVIAVL